MTGCFEIFRIMRKKLCIGHSRHQIGRVLRYFDRAIVATVFLNCCENRWFYPNCCRLPQVNCCMLPKASISRRDLPRKFPTKPNCCALPLEISLIVACCGQKCRKCCVLQPNFQMLRVAGYLNTSQSRSMSSSDQCIVYKGWRIVKQWYRVEHTEISLQSGKWNAVLDRHR